MEDYLRRIADLENQVGRLQERIKVLEQYSHMKEVPDWAKEAVDKAVAQKLVDTPQEGSYDFYRFLVILDRLGLLDK